MSISESGQHTVGGQNAVGTLETMTVVLNEQVHLLEITVPERQRVDFKKNITPYTTWFSKADTRSQDLCN